MATNVSRWTTERSGSIVKQRDRIDTFAGPGVVHYADEGVSASKINFADRPFGGRLLADLVPGDRVLVTRIDRAARSVPDLLGLVQKIEGRGASIVFVDQNIDTSGPMGRFILVLLAAIAELEAAIIAERRAESYASFLKEGRWVGGKIPFGLEAVDNPHGRGLVLRPSKDAERLRSAVARLFEGGTQGSLAQDIGMTETGVGVLLDNPRLAGMTPHPKGGVVLSEDGTPRVDADAAIFSMHEWVSLRELRDLRRQGAGWNRHDGIGPALQCGVCGERLYYQAPSKAAPTHERYRCRGKQAGRPEHANGSPGASVEKRAAERRVEALFLDQFGDEKGMTIVVVSDSEIRSEAIAVAKVQLLDVRRRQDAADTDEQEEVLLTEYLAAKRALRDAEALPSERTETYVPTGRTRREEWLDADTPARIRMLQMAGDWVVQPGRLPIEEKVSLRERRPDLSGIMAGLSPETEKAPRQ